MTDEERKRQLDAARKANLGFDLDCIESSVQTIRLALEKGAICDRNMEVAVPFLIKTAYNAIYEIKQRIDFNKLTQPDKE